MDIKWTCSVRSGSPLLSVEEQQPLKSRELLAGTRVLVPTIVGSYEPCDVAVKEGEHIAESSFNLYMLEYDEQYEEWISVGGINKLALEKLNLPK